MRNWGVFVRAGSVSGALIHQQLPRIGRAGEPEDRVAGRAQFRRYDAGALPFGERLLNSVTALAVLCEAPAARRSGRRQLMGPAGSSAYVLAGRRRRGGAASPALGHGLGTSPRSSRSALADHRPSGKSAYRLKSAIGEAVAHRNTCCYTARTGVLSSGASSANGLIDAAPVSGRANTSEPKLRSARGISVPLSSGRYKL